MAASVNLSQTGAFTAARRDPYTRLVKALDGDQYELRRMQRAIGGVSLDSHDIKLSATTDTNTAAGSSNIGVNLSTAGFTVASGCIASNERRDVFVECLVRDASNGRRYRWLQKTTVGVTAGELVIVGKATQFLTNLTAQLVCTSANGTTMTETTAQCYPPEWWDGASPVAADVSSNAFVVSWLGGNAPVGSVNPVSVCVGDAAGAAADARVFVTSSSSLTNGTTSIFISDVATPTAANLTAAAEITCTAQVEPPCSAVVGINATPAPDELILSLVGIASTALTWEVGVTISDAYRVS